MVTIPDVIFANGTVVTVNRDDRIYEAVAVKGSIIVSVGNTKETMKLAGPDTKIIDLKGRSVLPGFVDAHCHAGNHGIVQGQIQCKPQNMNSIEDLKHEIRRRAEKTPSGKWIIGRGYNHLKIKERRHPTRWDLDEASPDHKVFIIRTCGHIAVANSRVLQEFGIDKNTTEPEGGKIERDKRGEPTGVLYEKPVFQIRMAYQPNDNEIESGMKLMNEDFLKLGITSAHDASGADPNEIRMFQRGTSEGWIQVRIYQMVRGFGSGHPLGEHYLLSGLTTGFGNNRYRIGPYKFMIDGSGSGGSAKMREPYSDAPDNNGILYMSQEELDEKLLKAHAAGYQVTAHAIGDRALEMLLSSFKKALSSHPRENHRHRIEHCAFLDSSMINMIKKMKIIPVLGLPFLYELGDTYLNIFGRKRLESIYPFRSLFDKGVISALSSDTPVINPNPMHGLYFAVTHKSQSGQTIAPQEKVPLLKAIRAYTLNGAYASFEEAQKGSIEIGKLADLVVLSSNILNSSEIELLHTQVDLTMINGKIVFER